MSAIDGRALAELAKDRLAEGAKDRGLSLGIVMVGNDPVVRRFVTRKVAFGAAIGVAVHVVELPLGVSQAETIAAITAAARGNTGVIIQLPLPGDFDTQTVLDSIPPEKDVDVLSSEVYRRFLSGESKFIPPVAGAVRAILAKAECDPRGKRAAVIGAGRLVGAPVRDWLILSGASVTTADISTRDLSEAIRGAEILISGAGVPGLIMPEMVTPGAILIDAGTSEQNGKLVGDIDPSSYARAKYHTPVPGGVGPLTVAGVFENVVRAR